MILEYLQADPDIVEGAIVLFRGAYNAAGLVAAGLAFFAVGFAHRLNDKETHRLRAYLIGAVGAGLLLSVGAMVLRALHLSAGDPLLDTTIWDALLRSRNGDAFFIRSTGLVLILAALTPWRIGPSLAAIGACVVIASYAAVGHSTSIAPRQEIVAFLLVHLTAVAFWVGSMPVLAAVALRDNAEAAGIIDTWSRFAMGAVAAMLASAALLVWYLKAGRPIDFSGWFDFVLVAKLALVSVGLVLALLNRARLTPALRRGDAGAGRRLATAINVELLVLVVVLFAASELVSVHPNPPAPGS